MKTRQADLIRGVPTTADAGDDIAAAATADEAAG